MDILLYQEQSSSIFRCFLQMAARRKLSLQLVILRISNPMNPFSKRIPQIKNSDLDLPKGTGNPF